MAIIDPSGGIARTARVVLDFAHTVGTTMVLANVEFVGAFDDGRFIFLGPERIAENAESPARGMRTFSGYSSD